MDAPRDSVEVSSGQWAVGSWQIGNMKELAKSTTKYFWAMPLFGVERMVKSLCASDEAEKSFYVVKQSETETFSDLFNGAFQIGDAVQNFTIDLMFDALTFKAFNPAYVRELGGNIAQQSSTTFTSWGLNENRRLVLQELKNKYEVYNLVKNIDTLLSVPESGEFPLGELIEKAYSLGAYPDLWAVEGLGHDYATRAWESGKPPWNLLTDEKASVLPAKSLTMMHAGIGLAFAQKLMPPLTPYSSANEVRNVIDRFITLCRENSNVGYIGAAYESLGLVTRTWHPQLVTNVDKCLSEISEELLGYFWHGAGRALYFLPLYFVPGLLSAWRAAFTEPPHEIGKRNAIAGLAWATTLVNMRQPEIMLRLLRLRGTQLAQTDAFANGVASSIVMGWDITPDDVYIKSFCQYRPEISDSQITTLWHELISSSCQNALQTFHPALQKQNRLGDVFRYQSLSELAARL